MPSDHVAESIQQSLAEGEDAQDVFYMLDTLTRMRKPYHPDQEDTVVEGVAARILCPLVTSHPPEYVDALQKFRLSFRSICQTPALKGKFANSIRPAALIAASEEDLTYQPSLYVVHCHEETHPERSPADEKRPQLVAHLNRSVHELGLSIRCSNALINGDIRTLGDLVQKQESEILKIRHVGRKCLEAIRALLTDMDLSFDMNLEGLDW